MYNQDEQFNSSLRRLLSSPDWRTLEQLVAIIERELESQTYSDSDTAEQIGLKAVKRESEKRGIRKLIQRANQYAQRTE